MDFQEVVYIKLSVAQKEIALDILGEGNILLKKWSVYFPPKKYRQFRNAVMNGSLNPEYEGKSSIPSDRIAEFHKELPIMKAIRYKAQIDLDGRTVERAILEGYSAMAKKIANQWTLENDPVGLTKKDLLQEAYMQIVETMYSWLPGQADIGTLIWNSINNHMINVINKQGNMLSHYVNSDLSLLSRYKKTKKSMEHATFDQIIGELGLSFEEGQHLNGLLTRVYSENNFTSSDEEDCDYTNHIEKESQDVSSFIIEEDYVTQMLNRANLTKMQRELIEAAMNPYFGWQTDFANSHINPKTQKPYTRMRITQALETARAKVAKVLEKEAA